MNRHTFPFAFRLNIRNQLMLGLLPGLFLLLLLVALSYFEAHMLNQANRQILEVASEMDTIKGLQLAAQQALMPPNDALIRGAGSDEASRFDLLAAAVDQKFAQASPFFEESAELSLLSQARAGWEQVKTAGSDIVQDGQNPRAAVRMEEMDAAADQVTATLQQLHDLVAAELTQTSAASESSRLLVTRLLLAGAGLAIAGGIVFVFLYSRSLARPILALRARAEAMGRGDLKIVIPNERPDELGDLARTFNRMAAQLTEARADLENKVAERTRSLTAVNAVAEAASQSLDLQETLSQAIRKITAATEAEAAQVFLLDETRGELVPVATPEVEQNLPVCLNFPHPDNWPTACQTCSGCQTSMPEYGLACVPLLAKGSLVGTLNIARENGRPFTPEEMRSLSNIGHQLALAVENARLYQAEKSQRELAVTLRRAARQISALLEPTAVYQAILTHASQILDCDLACLLTVSGDDLEVAAVYGLPAAQSLAGYRFPLPTAPALARVVETRQAQTFCEPGRKIAFDLRRDQFEAIEWCLVVPLLRGANLLGLLTLEQRGHCYETQEEIQIAWTFANHAAVAFENAHLYAQVKQLNRELENRVQARTIELAEAHDLLQRQAGELRQVLHKTVRIQEKERQRIAQEVHDGLIQWVMGALFELQAAKVVLPSQPSQAKEKLQTAQDVLKNIKVEMRRLIYALQPPLLDTSGLLPAVEDLAANWQEVSGLRCRVIHQGEQRRFNPDWELTIYRIVQEALNNVEKHAAADEVTITLEFTLTQLRVTVRDDGTGFDPGSPLREAETWHLGLTGMRERALSIGGELTVSSQAQQGTEVILTVPLTAVSPTALLEKETHP